jgi:hypothetical protein
MLIVRDGRQGIGPGVQVLQQVGARRRRDEQVAGQIERQRTRSCQVAPPSKLR